jgi:hypothetical protein
MRRAHRQPFGDQSMLPMQDFRPVNDTLLRPFAISHCSVVLPHS